MRGNTISLLGNITRDAEVASTSGGNNVVSFGLAWNQAKKNAQGNFQDVPHFFEVKFWASDAQLRVVESQLTRGAACAVVDGHVIQERWQDKQGNARSRVVVMVDDPIKGLLVRPHGAPSAASAKAPARSTGGGYGSAVASDSATGYGRAQDYTQQSLGYGQANQPPVSVYDNDIPF